MPVQCAAVVGQSNQPLYLATFAGGDALRLHTAVHCSLDVVEDRVAGPARGAPGEAPSAYLGLLSSTDDCKVYGYLTSTRVKFLLVVDDPVVRDEEMRAIFRRVHTAYIDSISNPFYTPGLPLASPRFDASIRTIATSLGALT